MKNERHFILQVVDRDRWSPVLETRLDPTHKHLLHDILGADSAEDPDLEAHYYLELEDVDHLETELGCKFGFEGLGLADIDILLFRQSAILSAAPYLIHTNYELPLLLEGRKKLARMYFEYPPMTFPGEEQFDRWVEKDFLHKEVSLEPFDEPINGLSGIRTASYTPKGEEWRIPAMQLIWKASAKAGGWNESFERLEGMLYGYEDWQNDWWIESGKRGGGFGGMALCCAVKADGLAWVEFSGFQALPPFEEDSFLVLPLTLSEEKDWNALLEQNERNVALIKFQISAAHLVDLTNMRDPPPWSLPSNAIPQINRNLKRSLTVWRQRSQ